MKEQLYAYWYGRDWESNEHQGYICLIKEENGQSAPIMFSNIKDLRYFCKENNYKLLL